MNFNRGQDRGRMGTLTCYGKGSWSTSSGREDVEDGVEDQKRKRQRIKVLTSKKCFN